MNKSAPDEPESVREEQRAGWRPSLKPAHRLDEQGGGGRILEVRGNAGPARGLLQHLRNPLVLLTIALAILVSSAIAVDAFLDSGWAQAETRPKPNKHGSTRLPSS